MNFLLLLGQLLILLLLFIIISSIIIIIIFDGVTVKTSNWVFTPILTLLFVADHPKRLTDLSVYNVFQAPFNWESLTHFRRCVESPHLGKSGPQNPGNFCWWNPKSGKVCFWNPEYSSGNPESH